MRPAGRMRRGLQKLIDALPACPVMVEIGCYAGESTQIFADSGKFGLIWAVDPWLDGYDPDDQAATTAPMTLVEESFDCRMANYPFTRKLKMTSQQAARQIDQADFVYIDGDHRPAPLRLDIMLWASKTRWLGLHDYYHTAGTINKLLGEPDAIYEDSSCIYNLNS